MKRHLRPQGYDVQVLTAAAFLRSALSEQVGLLHAYGARASRRGGALEMLQEAGVTQTMRVLRRILSR